MKKAVILIVLAGMLMGCAKEASLPFPVKVGSKIIVKMAADESNPFTVQAIRNGWIQAKDSGRWYKIHQIDQLVDKSGK